MATDANDLTSPHANPLVDHGLLRERLATRERFVADHVAGVRRAAVVVAMFEHRDEPHIMIIKRVGGGTNAGQWALPGGKVDRDETPTAAAIRELAEETGMIADPQQVLGLLDDFATLSGFIITPIVVVVTGKQKLRRNPGEIASLHPIPIRRLAEMSQPRWTVGENSLLQLPLRHDMVIHAPTGAIIWQFAELALRRNDIRVNDLRQPDFTAR